MDNIAYLVGGFWAMLLLNVPAGVLVGLVGAKSWVRFAILGLICMALSTLLFVNPVKRTTEDWVFVGIGSVVSVLVDGLLVRAAVRAFSRRRAASAERLKSYS